MKLIPLPAFQDNYLWLLQDGHRALIVDPGDAPPVMTGLRQAAAQLQVILVTHHHADHTGGVDALRHAAGAKVYQARCEALRAQRRRTLPSTRAPERAINPFLRTRQPSVRRAAHAFNGAHDGDDAAVFAAIRQWKNDYR